MRMNLIPILDSIEGILIGNVIHQNEAHGPTVIGCGDGPVPLLPCCVLEEDKMGVRQASHMSSSEWKRAPRLSSPAPLRTGEE